jgi:hypothetical protein
MIINTAFTFPAIVFNSYVSAREKFVFQKSLLIVKTVLNPVFIVGVLLLGYGSVGMAVAVTVLSLLVELVNLWFCLRKAGMELRFGHFNPKLLKVLFVFSCFLFL